ncbi:MAG: single-stranded DNA-binding protein [Proteobacteria bacterium]|nr:single-stranded DNA-binding protein [Pseudomonadota bacterium]
MNAVVCTGWLQKAATVAYTPQQQRKLTFCLMLAGTGHDGDPTPWQCEVTDQPLIERVEPLMTPGRPLIVQAQLCGRAFADKGVQKGFVRYLLVTAIEFARIDRGGGAGQSSEEEETP